MATDTKPDPRLVGSTGVQQLLEWVDERPRSYPETIDAWKSSCPRLTIWEDALAARLIRIRAGRVHLTDAGRSYRAAVTPGRSNGGARNQPPR